jgi:hypothetical protein
MSELEKDLPFNPSERPTLCTFFVACAFHMLAKGVAAQVATANAVTVSSAVTGPPWMEDFFKRGARLWRAALTYCKLHNRLRGRRSTTLRVVDECLWPDATLLELLVRGHPDLLKKLEDHYGKVRFPCCLTPVLVLNLPDDGHLYRGSKLINLEVPKWEDCNGKGTSAVVNFARLGAVLLQPAVDDDVKVCVVRLWVSAPSASGGGVTPFTGCLNSVWQSVVEASASMVLLETFVPPAESVHGEALGRYAYYWVPLDWREQVPAGEYDPNCRVVESIAPFSQPTVTEVAHGDVSDSSLSDSFDSDSSLPNANVSVVLRLKKGLSPVRRWLVSNVDDAMMI